MSTMDKVSYSRCLGLCGSLLYHHTLCFPPFPYASIWRPVAFTTWPIINAFFLALSSRANPQSTYKNASRVFRGTLVPPLPVSLSAGGVRGSRPRRDQFRLHLNSVMFGPSALLYWLYLPEGPTLGFTLENGAGAKMTPAV